MNKVIFSTNWFDLFEIKNKLKDVEDEIDRITQLI